MRDNAYHVLTLDFPAAAIELVQAYLYAAETLGVLEENPELAPPERHLWRAYFSSEQDRELLGAQLASAFPELKIRDVSTVQLNPQQWQATSFPPMRLAGPYWVVAPSDLGGPELPSAHELIIRPGLAFGTGRHETTQLMANLLLGLSVTPRSLLDVGCGSGILAILAHRLGVPRCVGVEISDDARSNAAENFKLNAATVLLYEKLQEVTESFAVIMANILTPTLLHLRSDLIARLEAGGHLLLSGITGEEPQLIEHAYAELHLIERQERDGWFAYHFLKS